jgi:hypothetical protein
VDVLLDKGVQVGAADFFLSFDQELEIDRRRALGPEKGLGCRQVRIMLALVVAGAACVQTIVAQGGLKRR